MATPLQYSNHRILLLSLKEAQTILRRNHCFKSGCMRFRFPFGHISIVSASFNSTYTYSKCEAPVGSLALPAPLGIAGSLNQLMRWISVSLQVVLVNAQDSKPLNYRFELLVRKLANWIKVDGRTLLTSCQQFQ